VDRYVKRLTDEGWATRAELEEIDARIAAEIDAATDACLNEPLPDAATALDHADATRARADTRWYRR
ncbi:MAG: hypothetical protein ACREN5_07990, partial [Gemmatimonadales bacterium]